MKHILIPGIIFLLLLTSCQKETCFDGKQNQMEEQTDCGGPCTACPTCYDGIQNQNETDVDCGGFCSEACPSCYDGIQNQGETGIDCGGPCGPCPVPSLSASINDTDFHAHYINCYLESGGLYLIGSDHYTIYLKYNGNFKAGTYTLSSENGKVFSGAMDQRVIDQGTITFTQFDTYNEMISGSFQFTCVDGTVVSEGYFTSLSYD